MTQNLVRLMTIVTLLAVTQAASAANIICNSAKLTIQTTPGNTRTIQVQRHGQSKAITAKAVDQMIFETKDGLLIHLSDMAFSQQINGVLSVELKEAKGEVEEHFCNASTGGNFAL
jgi:hypothetical protein